MDAAGQINQRQSILIERLYSAALGETSWRGALLAVRDHLFGDEAIAEAARMDAAHHLADINSADDLARLQANLRRQPRVAGRLESLAPHLIRALELRRRLFAEVALGQAAVTALDALPHGVIFLDGGAVVVFRNWVAQDIVYKRQGIELDGERVRAIQSENDSRLQRLIEIAISYAGHPRPVGIGALCLEGAAYQDRLLLTVWSLPVELPHGNEPQRPSVALFIASPSRPGEGLEEVVRETFGLTPREGALARQLLAGHDLAEASERMGVSRKTARAHLERIFSKTRTHRQVELVRLLAAGLSPANGLTRSRRGECSAGDGQTEYERGHECSQGF